ncbi:MAG: adenylate/guanylate cyclase domain-containing protein [Desulfobaccales bacterium]|nr:adenylate/guanylate cyclase domain-containing protein [Desulfobaccales bacterium]
MSLSIRTYLSLSYAALIALLILGMLMLTDWVEHKMAVHNLEIAQNAVQEVTAANVQVAEEVLTKNGEYIVKDKAEDVARELAYLLKGKKTYNYAQMRQDKNLRKIAIQDISTVEGVAGYTDLYDKGGEIIFHPDKQVEGQNQAKLEWQKEYPETWKLIKRSLTTDNVTGYYTFFDKDGKNRRRFSARVHVPGTPFIVGAIVNIDEFFVPTQEEIKKASQGIMAKAKESMEEASAAIDRKVHLAGLIGAIFFSLLGGLSAVWFAATISRPLVRLRNGVRQVGEGNFAVAVPEKGAKEILHLAHSFNQLGDQLTDYIAKRDFIRDTFGRYVTQEVVKKLLESKEALELGGETREVSILMSDLRGFTALTADMAPEEVIIFLNRYLGKMIEILVDYHAVIDEIVGDGLLAFFGAPEPQEDHPVRAVACALEMQAAMDEINFLNEADGLPHLEMGIGVNTGSVVVGNIGSEKRTKYSVIGSPVNFTARAESSSVGGQVLISASTYAKVKDLVEVGDVLEVEMKGVPGAATLYDVHAIKGPYNIKLKERSETLIPLKEKINIHLCRIHEKIITGATGAAWITHLSEIGATVVYEGELKEWEDVRIHLLDESLAEIPGKIYGKVISVKPLGDNLHEAAVRFTSISREAHQIMRQARGNA